MLLLSSVTFPLRVQAEAPGLTHYTRRVLERARQANTDAAESEPWAMDDLWFWLQNGMSAVFGTRDSNVTRTAEQLRLPQMTACQYADIMLILHEMEKTRRKMKEIRDARDSFAARNLANLYDFLHERMKALEQGGTRPGYVDADWSVPRTFDPPDARDALREEKLCPFSTVYMDTSLNGSVGCTQEKLDAVLAMLQAELAGEMEKGIEATRAERDVLQRLLDKLNEIRLPEDPAPVPGVQEEGCRETWPGNLRTWSAGRFLGIPGARFPALVRLLLHLELLRTSPFQPENPLTWNIGLTFFHAELARDSREFTARQARGDALIRMGIVESRGIEEAFFPLTRTIGTLSRLVQTIHPDEGDMQNDRRSLRDLVRDAAYFLRRNCMNRGCNATLDRVLGIVTADPCFPYTRGDADLPEGATQEERDAKVGELKENCANEAQVPVDGL